jgi:glyoxylase I family protein
VAAPFNVIGIDHIVLRAADLAALERFYVDVLGLRVEMRQHELTQLRAGKALIDIVPAGETGLAGAMAKRLSEQLADLSVRVKNAEDAAMAAEKEAHDKIAVRKEQATYCCQSGD